MESTDKTLEIEEWAKSAAAGDRKSLERLLGAVRGFIYALAVKMLWHPEDASDATQEILIQIMTRLSQFKGKSRFTTWAYRVAANRLIDFRRSRSEKNALSFEAFGEALRLGLTVSDRSEIPEDKVLVEEVKIGCSQGMLLCLKREKRMAYILGEIFEMPSDEASWPWGSNPLTTDNFCPGPGSRWSLSCAGSAAG